MLIPMAAAGLKSNGGVATPTLDTATSWWHAGDITGGVTLNDQITTNDLTIVGSPTVDNDGTHNRIVLDATDTTYLDGGNIFDNDGATDLTIILAWLWRADTGSISIVVAKRDGGGNGYNLFVSSPADTLATNSDGGGTVATLTGDDITADENTTKFGTAFGFSGGTGDTQFIYHNAGTRATRSAGTGDYSNTDEFRIGRGSGGTGFPASLYFYGAAVWDGTALTDGQIDTAVTELFAAAEV